MHLHRFLQSIFLWVKTHEAYIKPKKLYRVAVTLIFVIPQLQTMWQVTSFQTPFHARSCGLFRVSCEVCKPRRLFSKPKKRISVPLSELRNGPYSNYQPWTFSRKRFTLRSIHGEHMDGWNAKEDNEHQNKFLTKIQNSMCNEIFPNLIDGELENNSRPVIVLLLAVSGGCDSIGLLHAMMKSLDRKLEVDQAFSLSLGEHYTFRCKNGKFEGIDFICEPHVVHFDHQQRGAESTGDQAFVENICRILEVPFHSYKWCDTVSDGELRSFSQEVARDWRRTKLTDLLKNLTKGDGRRGTILTAHHKDDSNETILLKLLRGTHITNLSGMEPFTKLSSDANVSFARPMLDVTKNDVIQYLESHSIAWREDESNSSNKYKRNKVRNELMPMLSEIVGGEEILQKRLDNLAEQSQEIKEDLDFRAMEYLEENDLVNGNTFSLPELIKPLTLVQKEALHSWADNIMDPHTFSYTQLSRVCKQLNDYPDSRVWTLNVGGGYDLVRNGDTLCLSCSNEKESKGADDGFENLSAELQDSNLLWSKMDSDTADREPRNSSDILVQLPPNLARKLETDEIHFVLTNITNSPGLKFNPPWRRNRTPLKMKDFLRGQKVPLHRRSCASIVCAQAGTDTHAVAVFVEDTKAGDELNGKWVVNCDFEANQAEGVKVILHGVS